MTAPLQPTPAEPWLALVEELLDGPASESLNAESTSLDREAISHVADHLMLDSLLAYLHEEDHQKIDDRVEAALSLVRQDCPTAMRLSDRSTTANETSAVVIEVKPTSLSRRIKRYDSIHWQRHKIRFNAMTAVLTALAWVGFSYFVWFSTTPDFVWFSTTPDDSRPNRSDNIQYVAEITGQHEARWADDLHQNTVLLSGERLNLVEGLIEITFYDGAVVVLEGPTDFVVDSSGAGTLDRGKLAAKVPQQAIGFSIETPSATFVDLGTEFGVEVREDGLCEVHVFIGAVETRSHIDGVMRTATRIEAGESVQVTMAGEIVPVASSATHFVRVGEMPSPPQLLAPVNLVSSEYHRPYQLGVHHQVNRFSREHAFEAVTNGTISQVFTYRDGFDTWCEERHKTDFAGLIYGEPMRFDKIFVYMGGQAVDGGSWEAEPHLFLLHTNVDTDQTFPEEDPVHWRRIDARLVSGPASFDEAVDPDPGATLIFDLTHLPEADRVGFGWAVGGVDGDGNVDLDGDPSDGVFGFVLITELRAYGDAGSLDNSGEAEVEEQGGSL